MGHSFLYDASDLLGGNEQQPQPSDPIDDSHQYDDGDDTDQEVENDDGRLEDDAQGTFIFMLEVSSYFLIFSSLRALCTFFTPCK